MYFWTYGLSKTFLDKCLKTSVSEDPSTSDIINGLKHCWKFNESTFTILIDPCEGNSGTKSPCEWYGKSWDCFLTHWLPITSILFLIETIYSNIFRCNYIRNQKHFLNLFFFTFSEFTFNFEHFQKKMILITDLFLNWRTRKDVVTQMSKKSRFRRPLDK